MTKFSDEMKASLEGTINGVLGSTKHSLNIDSYGISQNLTLVGSGISVHKNFLSSVVDGTVHPMNKSDNEAARKNLGDFQ